MDILLILILVLVALLVIGAAFASMRKRQRSGTVLAAPDAHQGDRR